MSNLTMNRPTVAVSLARRYQPLVNRIHTWAERWLFRYSVDVLRVSPDGTGVRWLRLAPRR